MIYFITNLIFLGLIILILKFAGDPFLAIGISFIVLIVAIIINCLIFIASENTKKSN